MSLDLQRGIDIYSSMCRMRAFEDRLITVYKQGHVSGGVFTGNGNEALCCTAASFLRPQDALGPTHRSTGAHFAKGVELLEMARQWLARGTGGTFGKDNAAHLGDLEKHVFGIISPLATMLPLSAGAALRARVKDDDVVALTFIGDGGTSCGDFHEGLALMSDLKLPVVVVIENNQYAYSTPVERQHRRDCFARHGDCFNIPWSVVDGTDIAAVYKALEPAFERARSGAGPTLVEGVTWRMTGHSLADRADYVRDGFYEEGRQNDPLLKTRAWLLEKGAAESDLEDILNQWTVQAREAFAKALEEPAPDPVTVTQGIYAEATS